MKVSSDIITSKQYRQVLRFFDCTNYIYLDQIKNVQFNKISGYKKSKDIFNRIYGDFIVIDKMLNEKELLNSATLLRKVYEDIIYIIVTSYDNKFVVTIDSKPSEFRRILKNHCVDIFGDGITPDFFDYIYEYLCKIIHPCSLKELISHIYANPINRKYVLNSIRFMMLTIEYIYLSFINNNNNVDNTLNESIWAMCWLVNLFNSIRYYHHSKKSMRIVKKYLINDIESKYINRVNTENTDFAKYVQNNPKEFEDIRDGIIERVQKEIKRSKYNDDVDLILRGRKEELNGK